MHGDRPMGTFPGPWEKDLVPDGVSAKSYLSSSVVQKDVPNNRDVFFYQPDAIS